MKKYAIIDLEKIDLNKVMQDEFSSYDALRAAVLSPEETEAVFKRVYTSAIIRENFAIDGDINANFDEFKKTL